MLVALSPCGSLMSPSNMTFTRSNKLLFKEKVELVRPRKMKASPPPLLKVQSSIINEVSVHSGGEGVGRRIIWRPPPLMLSKSVNRIRALGVPPKLYGLIVICREGAAAGPQLMDCSWTLT